MTAEEQQKKDEFFMRAAIEEAQEAMRRGEIPIGAVVVAHDRIIARAHNLKGVDLSIPRGKMVVITGISGSGKSSLAFDTIYAEGQRRCVPVPSGGRSSSASSMAATTRNEGSIGSHRTPFIPKPPSAAASWKKSAAS